MRALLKSGKWVEIDTSFLFENQYNTTEEYGGERIFDGQIQKIEDDARIGKGRCKYCGAIVEKGQEEDHFTKMEEIKKTCSMDDIEVKSCFWKRRHYLGKAEVKSEIKTEIVDGIAKTVELRTIEEKWIPYCSHEEAHGGCTHDKHREMGISWFTEENCFFLKYPNGYEQFTLADWTNGSWYPKYNSETNFVNKSYSRMLGSYRLEMELSADKKHVEMFTLKNGRKNFKFQYVNGEYIVFDGINGSPRTTKDLLEVGGRNPKCNTTVNKAVRMAVEDIMKHEK